MAPADLRGLDASVVEGIFAGLGIDRIGVLDQEHKEATLGALNANFLGASAGDLAGIAGGNPAFDQVADQIAAGVQAGLSANAQSFFASAGLFGGPQP